MTAFSWTLPVSIEDTITTEKPKKNYARRMGMYWRWSAYGQTGRLTRLTFFATDALSILLSLACLSYGAWLVHNRSQYAELLAPSLYVDVGRIMIVVSLLSMINSCIAIYGVLNELRCCVYSYTVASIIIFVMLFIGGIMGFVFCNQLSDHIPLDLKMSTSLRELYGSQEMDKVKQAWDELQTNFRCCGVNGTENYTMWKTSKWYMHQRVEKTPVPPSCCVPNQYDACIREARGQDPIKHLYTDTCYDPLKKDLLAVVSVAAWLSIISSGVQLVPAICATFYAQLIRK